MVLRQRGILTFMNHITYPNREEEGSGRVQHEEIQKTTLVANLRSEVRTHVLHDTNRES
jgi:hypothetical protein